jgi:thiamine-monophosphate kinase
MLISDLGERALIERIRSRTPAAPAWVVVGIGDDAAVLEPERGELDVITTDCQVEDIHFKRAWMPMHAIGRKALAVNVSDLAAMGAAPRAATLSLALPPSLDVADFDGLIDGFLALAREVRVTLAGGNLSRSPGPIMIDITLTGSVRRRKILTRTGGRAGHLLYVTGALGRVAANVARLQTGEGPGSGGTPDSGDAGSCGLLPVSPLSRLRCGQQVGRNRAASACMDISDGLADAVSQIASASGTGARVISSNIPVDPVATLEQALSGGEDYELLFAVPPRKRRAFEQIAGREAVVTPIGELTADPAVVLDRDGRIEPLGAGFAHF